MRFALHLTAAVAALTMSVVSASAAPTSTATIDMYSFAGGRDAIVIAPLQSGRSVATDRMAPQAFTKDDVAHAFAPWGFAD